MARAWEVVEHSSAPIERVWDILVDTRSWNVWGRFRTAKLEHLGELSDDGVGAIRVFGNAPILSREQVVVSDAPKHFAYTLLSGMPVNNYRADVFLASTSSGTTITWKSGFDSARPAFTGGFFAWFLKRFITDTAKRLARYAETSG